MIVCVTGCSRGLGRAMVEEFARLGWTVVGCARRAEVLKEMQAGLGAPHSFHPCDVAVEAEVAGFVKQVLEKHGAPDLLLIPPAGLTRKVGPWPPASTHCRSSPSPR